MILQMPSRKSFSTRYSRQIFCLAMKITPMPNLLKQPEAAYLPTSTQESFIHLRLQGRIALSFSPPLSGLSHLPLCSGTGRQQKTQEMRLGNNNAAIWSHSREQSRKKSCHIYTHVNIS